MINLVVECIKLLLAMCGILNFKFHKSKSAAVIFSASITILMLIGIYDISYQISGLIFLAVIISGLLVKGKYRFLFAVLSFFCICCIDELLLLVIKSAFKITDETMSENPAVFSAANAFSIILLTAAAMIMQNFYYKKRQSPQDSLRNSNVLYLILFVIGQIAALIFIAPFTLVEYKSNLRNNQIVAFAVCILGLLFLVFGVLLIYNNNSKNHYKQVAEMNQKLLRSQEKYYQMLLDKENETRKFRHDISNHILCVDALIKEQKYDEAESYLSDLKGSLSELRPRHQTGNMLVNAIVNDISSKYESVNLVWTGIIPEKLQMSNMDVCVIFSNVLENAFYAASDCLEDGKVDVVIKSLSNSLTISIRNNMSKPVEESKGKLITQKSDKKNHGFGTMNVRTCVNVNGGSVEYKYTEKIFTTEIVLPNVI